MGVMKYKNILFDFDGTLADTREGIVRTVQGTLERMGLAPAAPADIVKTIGLPLTECFRRATTTPESRIEEAAQVYRDIFPLLALDHITPFDGVLHTLADLRSRGIVMAIASSRHHISLDPLVEQLGISRHIPLSQVYGEDERLRPKPAPDLALSILQGMNLQASETLVVGDTIYDLMMGSAAGCHTCGVTYGNQSREQLATATPDHIIDHLPALLSLIDQVEAG